MKTVTLQAFTDESTGVLGLGVKGMSRDETTNASTDGLGIAHDLIEHVNGVREIGGITDELEALGAIWFVRGQYNDIRRDRVGSMYTVHQNLASDIVRMFRDFFYGAYVDLKPVRTYSCVADDDFRQILEHAMEDARKEIDDDEDSAEVKEKERAYMAACLPRLRIGYRKAKRKYKRGTAANNLFWEIAEAVDPVARRIEFEGQEFKLTYGYDRDGNSYARVSEAWEDYE